MEVYFTGCGGDIGAGKYNDGSVEARGQLADRLLAGMEASIASTRFMPVGTLAWRTDELTLPAKDTTKEPTIGPIELSSLEIGPVHILHLPGEPMVAYQLYAQKQMPDQYVAVAGYGDASTGYICTAKAFEKGRHEPRASRVAPGSEELLKSATRRLLGLK